MIRCGVECERLGIEDNAKPTFNYVIATTSTVVEGISWITALFKVVLVRRCPNMHLEVETTSGPCATSKSWSMNR
jgi:hypothetical protein